MKPPHRCRLLACALLILVCGWTIHSITADEIDWNRAKDLFQRSQRGEQLTPDDAAYLELAKKAHAAMDRGRQQETPREPKAETGLVPLTDLAQKYKGQEGGLYGPGRNEPPPELAKAAATETAKIRPLGPEGDPSPNGKIVLLSIGMSNTTQEFSTFIGMANADRAKSPRLILVDGAQGGQTADRIANSSAPFWTVIEQRLAAAGVTARQVEVIWLKEAIARPEGEFPASMERLKSGLITDIQIAKERYPNLRIAYLSSRIYGGYAATSLNPEPYAYEGAFAVRGVIEDQMKAVPGLNPDPARGPVKAPLLLWGPYLWTDGIKGRKTDGLVWNREDVGPDGTHPSETGRQKVAEQLLRFFKSDPNAGTWFTNGASGNPGPRSAVSPLLY